MRTVSIKDISEKLGISRNTISKVLNGKEGVLPETERIIIKAAYEMGYNKLSQALLEKIDETAVSKKETGMDSRGTRHIVLLTRREHANVFWSAIISGIYSALSAGNYSLIYSEILETEDGFQLPEILTSEKADGLIVMNIYDLEIWKKIRECNIPTVFLDSPRELKEEDIFGDIVLTEGTTSTRTITSNLLDKGAKKLAFIGDITYCQTIYDRWTGFCQAVDFAGIRLEPAYLFTKDSESKYYSKESIKNVLDSMQELPDAIVCANDHIAQMVIQRLQARNVEVPQNIRITGFDDEPDDVIVHPYLTSVSVDCQYLGGRLVQQLLWRMENREHPFEAVCICTKVKFRESSM